MTDQKRDFIEQEFLINPDFKENSIFDLKSGFLLALSKSMGVRAKKSVTQS